MKKSFKKNQIIIVALTMLIAIAGYISFSGKNSKKEKDEIEEVFAEDEADISNDDVFMVDDVSQATSTDGLLAENMELNSDEDEIGNAVLASSDASGNMASIKLTREQSRSKQKEQYLEIINGEGMDQIAIDNATKEYMSLAKEIELEENTESLLVAKGFTNAIVAIGDGNVDVVIESNGITDTEKAQIEDIVERNTGYSVDKLTISTYQGSSK